MKLRAALAGIPEHSTAMSSDHVPFVAAYLRDSGATSYTDRDWLRRHNVDRIERSIQRRHTRLAMWDSTWQNLRDKLDIKLTDETAAHARELAVSGLQWLVAAAVRTLDGSIDGARAAIAKAVCTTCSVRATSSRSTSPCTVCTGTPRCRCSRRRPSPGARSRGRSSTSGGSPTG